MVFHRRLRRLLWTMLAAAVLLAAIAGASPATRVYPDRAGDLRGGAGPDVVSLTISNTATAVTLRIRFRTAPPLRVSAAESWVDMLLIGVDVPPIGAAPVAPGGEWRGMDFALGTHGPSTQAILTRLQGTTSRVVRRFPIRRQGTTLILTLQRSWLGSPDSFRFSLAVAREGEGDEGGVDLLPNAGTARYVMTS